MQNFSSSNNNFKQIPLDHASSVRNERAYTFQDSRRKLFLKKLLKPKILISTVVLFLLIVGGVSAFFLSQTSQDVRQQASGCVYWNGEAATEGSVDNRGGIRQECKNGLWTTPSDGNLDPSEIIAEKEAARPKSGCVTWDGSEVSHGATDNRGGIRQQCSDGLWDRPDDGITDPKQTGAIEVSDTVQGMETKELSYQESIGTYNEHCRETIAAGAEDFCKQLDKLLRDEANRIRYSALDTAVKGNTETVQSALAGLDDRSMGYGDASSVYQEYCSGSKSQQTSASACQSLRAELDEISAIREAAETAKYTALTERVTTNTDVVANAIGGLDERTVDVNDARTTYREYCEGAKAQQTSVSTCQALKSEIDEIIALREAAETAKYTALTEAVTSNTSSVESALGELEDRSMDVNEARTTYREYCEGAKAQQTSVSACQALESSINEIDVLVAQSNENKNEVITNNTRQVTLAVDSLNRGIMDSESAQATYDEYCSGIRAQQTSTSACENLEIGLQNIASSSTSNAYSYSSWDAYTNIVQSNNSSVEVATQGLENNTLSIEEALIIEEQICEENSQQVSTSKCQELTRSINAAFTTRRWEAYQAVVEENVASVDVSVEDLESGEVSIEDTEQLYLSSCVGVKAQHTPASVCNEFRERLDNADIFISNFTVERVIPDEFLTLRNDNLDARIFALAENDFTDFESNTGFEYINVRNDLAEVVDEEALEMSELGIETIYCQAGNVCEYYHDGIVETIAFTDIADDIEAYNLDEESFRSLRENGVFVSGRSNSQLIRETGEEISPVEIQVCVRACEWIAPTEQNLRGLAYTVISDMDDLEAVVPDMDGNGYILANDLDIFLENAPLVDLLEIIVSNDSNWNDYEVETLIANYDNSDLDLLIPAELPYDDYVETIEAFSLTQAVYDTYGLDMHGQSFWELEEAINNVNQYIAYSKYTNALSSIPFLGPLSSLIFLPTDQIEDCSNVSHQNVCFIQTSIINSVNATAEVVDDIDTWEDRTGVSFQYAGDMDLGTLMVFDYAIDLLPEYYWDGIDGIVVTGHEVDEDSAGYTYMTGTFQMDQCANGGASCITYGHDFWWRLSVIAHETAHNRQDVTVDAGNYCFEVGDCVEIEETATGRDILDEYLSDAGITVNPDNSLSVSSVHNISYYSEEAYAFTNAKEFYAEILADAITDPEDFAASDPELYRLAVIINGFETETYVDENGVEMIRRKSQ